MNLKNNKEKSFNSWTKYYSIILRLTSLVLVITYFKVRFSVFLSAVTDISNVFFRNYFCWQSVTVVHSTAYENGSSIDVLSAPNSIVRETWAAIAFNPPVTWN